MPQDGSDRWQDRLPYKLVGRTDWHNLGEDPFADVRLFAAAHPDARQAIFDQEMRREVEAILHLTHAMDAFDLIELLRLRELPIAPVAGLDASFDGSAVAIELISLVMLCRRDRFTPDFDVNTEPHLVIDDLHRSATRLQRLTIFLLLSQFDSGTQDPLSRLALEYRMHSLTVRSMQYQSVQAYHDRELFDRQGLGPLLRTKLGFDYSEFVSVRNAIQHRYSRILTDLRDTTADIVMKADADGRESTAEELHTFHTSMGQWMFAPGQRASFTAQDIAAECLLELATVESVLSAFSIGFDSARDPVRVVKDFLRGENPLARTCLVRDGSGQHVMTSMQIGDDSFRSIFEATLRSDSKARETYNRARTRVTEDLALRFLERALDTHATHRNLHYLSPKSDVESTILGRGCTSPRDFAEQAEADGLFVIEDVAICVEVKGRTIADTARRGDLRRLRTEVENVIGSGAGQAGRLASLIADNGGVWTADGAWLDLNAVREVHCVVAGLDSFGPLAVTLGDLVGAHVVEADRVPWVSSLHDLDVISRVVDRPAEFLLYLRRRTEPEVTGNLRGVDELDFFTLFLGGGLYVEPDPDVVREQHPAVPPPTNHLRRLHEREARPTRVATFTDQLDAWMYGVEGSSPFEVDKPRFNTNESIASLVDFLADGRKPGWLRFGADLLGISGTAQQKLAREIRNLVRRTRADGLAHSLAQGFAGPRGYPAIFVVTAPHGQPHDLAVRRLQAYMTVKKHQLGSDRSLGIVLDEEHEFRYLLYLNDPPGEDVDLDELAVQMHLGPVGVATPAIPPSARRSTQRLRGSRPKNRRTR